MPVNPTRINLINTRKSIRLANKGYSLLKKKREVLVIEFLKLLKESSAGREQLNFQVQSAYKTLALAFAYAGELEIQQSAVHLPESMQVRVSTKNIMGVKIPEIYATQSSSGEYTVPVSAAIDDTNIEFTAVLSMLVDVARREQGLRRLAIEIEKVKRRVNALEYVRIPQMRARAAYISMRLDEMDRDMFSALKHVKKRIEQKQAHQSM